MDITKREKQHKGYDLFKDQIEEMERMAAESGIIKAKLVRQIWDAGIKSLKEKLNNK